MAGCQWCALYQRQRVRSSVVGPHRKRPVFIIPGLPTSPRETPTSTTRRSPTFPTCLVRPFYHRHPLPLPSFSHSPVSTFSLPPTSGFSSRVRAIPATIALLHAPIRVHTRFEITFSPFQGSYSRTFSESPLAPPCEVLLTYPLSCHGGQRHRANSDEPR